MKKANKYTKLIMFFLLLFSGEGAYALTGQEYLEKINSNYKTLKSFELVLNYQVYKGHNGRIIEDEYESTLRIDGKKSHRKIYDDEFITTADMSLVVNHQFKTIQVLPGAENDIFDQDIARSLEHCQDVKVDETKDGTRLILTFKQYSSIEYARIDVLVDANFWVKNMTMYYAKQVNFSKDYYHPEYDYPRLEVSYKNLKKGWKDKQGLTEFSNYVIKTGENYKAVPLYQNYEVIQ